MAALAEVVGRGFGQPDVFAGGLHANVCGHPLRGPNLVAFEEAVN